MNKEQIDEIALRLTGGALADSSVGRTTIDFTHALLAELAKVQEPVGFIAHNPGGCYEGCHIPAAPYNFAEFYGEMPTVGTKLFTLPLPQPDLVAEIERLKQRHEASDGITKMQISELRQQLSAAQQAMDASYNTGYADGYRTCFEE